MISKKLILNLIFVSAPLVAMQPANKAIPNLNVKRLEISLPDRAEMASIAIASTISTACLSPRAGNPFGSNPILNFAAYTVIGTGLYVWFMNFPKLVNYLNPFKK